MSQEVKILLGIGIASLLLVVGASIFLGGSSAPDSTGQKFDPTVLVSANSHKTTTTPTKVTIVEFGDYQCPACGVAHPIVKQVLQAYGNKITFVFRNFPLTSVHQNALSSAEAAEAAGAQGKFWEMHDMLYENQKEWSDLTDPLPTFVGYAKKIGLDIAKFEKDVKDSAYSNVIQLDQKDGNSVEINATPTFFINGEKQTGILSVDQFKAKIDPLLK